EGGAGLVADGAEAIGEAGGVVEVGALQAHPEGGDEAEGGLDAGDALPEPVAHREGAGGVAERGELLLVEGEVADLVTRDAQAAEPERLGRVGEGEDGPAHQL